MAAQTQRAFLWALLGWRLLFMLSAPPYGLVGVIVVGVQGRKIVGS